jgi:hypothetical protein
VPEFLPSVLNGEEHGLGGGTAGAAQSIEKWHRLLGRLLQTVGEPLLRQGPPLFEVGGDHVHNLVQCRGEGYLGRRDRGLPGVRGLEDARIHDYLAGPRCGVRAQADVQGVVVGEGSGETCHRRGDPLVPRHHSLDNPLLRGQDLGEEGVLFASHSRPLSHARRPFRSPNGPGEHLGDFSLGS